MSFHIRFFSLINKNRVVKSVTEKDANLIILRLTPLTEFSVYFLLTSKIVAPKLGTLHSIMNGLPLRDKRTA